VLKHLNERRQDEQGFTLIELMVVVLIMGILMAIAIPTFLSTQGSANDSSAKSNATNVLTSEKAYYEDNQVYLDASSTGTTGSSLDPNMPWGVKDTLVGVKNTVIAEVGGLTSGVAPIIPTATGQVLLIEDLSKSGTCFYIYDSEATAGTPVLAYAEATSCVLPAYYPTASPAASGSNAGANIQTTGAGFTATTGWYASW
jgi:type IV pilus assembly protein PilA